MGRKCVGKEGKMNFGIFLCVAGTAFAAAVRFMADHKDDLPRE